MDIYVLDGLNGVKSIVENFKSAIWNVQYSGKSDFTLVAPATNQNINSLTIGAYLVRADDVSANEFKNVMIIEGLQIDISPEDGWLITATGRSLKALLCRRVIWQQANLSGRAEASIRSLITSEVISPSAANRAISNFILGADAGLQATLDTQCFGENLGDWVEAVCTSLGYGWDITIINNKYVFKMYEGIDRTTGASQVVFTPSLDNLLSSSYRNNKSEYHNAALVGGEGEGTSKRTASVGTASGLDRFETYIDGSSVSSNGEIITLQTYLNMLKGYGQTELDQSKLNSESFEGEVEYSGIYTLNQDYFLGDLVMIINELNISATARINEIIYAEDENGASVVPTFSEWEVN